MKKSLSFLLFGMLVAAMSCTPKPVADKNEALVDSLMAADISLWNSQSAEKVMTMWADDGIMIFQDGAIISGKDSLLAFFTSAVPHLKNFNINKGPYSITDGLLTLTGLYSFDWIGDDQVVYPNRGSGTFYEQKQPDGSWKTIMGVYHQANVVKK